MSEVDDLKSEIARLRKSNELLEDMVRRLMAEKRGLPVQPLPPQPAVVPVPWPYPVPNPTLPWPTPGVIWHAPEAPDWGHITCGQTVSEVTTGPVLSLNPNCAGAPCITDFQAFVAGGGVIQ